MKLLFLTGSRGEWGYIRPILRLCENKSVKFHVCGTNMHLLASHGLSAEEIERDGFAVSDPLYMALDGQTHYSMAKSLGVGLMGFADILMRIRPDWLVLAGDRGEQLMGAIAGAYTYTPVAHIQAGELSGNIDGMARHAIGKLAHLHFASNEDAGRRLIKLGEEPHRVKVVGAPQLDELAQGFYAPYEELAGTYGLPENQGYVLLVQHSVTEEYEKAGEQIAATMEAVRPLDRTKVWILPNNDAGGDIIRRGILSGRTSDTLIFKNLPRRDFLGLLKNADCIVGNSSAGLIEAPSFEIPAVNVGRRQDNRVRGLNVVDVPDFSVETIRLGLKKALSKGFVASLRGMENPYGDGNSASRIFELLKTTPIDSSLLIKQLTY